LYSPSLDGEGESEESEAESDIGVGKSLPSYGSVDTSPSGESGGDGRGGNDEGTGHYSAMNPAVAWLVLDESPDDAETEPPPRKALLPSRIQLYLVYEVHLKPSSVSTTPLPPSPLP